MNAYSLLADALTFIHFLYVSFVVVGQLAIMIGWVLRWKWIRNPWFRSIHLAMILIVAVESYYDIICPLTTWELQLRVLAGQLPVDHNGSFALGTENFSFVARLVHRLYVFEFLADDLDALYFTFAGVTLATAVLVPPRFRKRV
jgi:hypothetical protein